MAAGESPDKRPRSPTVAVVIPCFRAGATVGNVIRSIGEDVSRIYVVDDGCPDGTGEQVLAKCSDPRVAVLHNGCNLGVGGAVKRGYAEALRDGADIIVKMDADGQMNAAHISLLCAPIVAGQADYAKGNRFAPRHRMPPGGDAESSRPMPPVRRFGNSLLSFLHKGITGYWNVVDPTNGFTAIHRRVLESLDLKAVADCYFFETDLLVQLNLADAVVRDVPLPARYSGEVSSLKVRRFVVRFPRLAIGRLTRRIVSKYFLQDFNFASVGILLGLPLVLTGVGFGLSHRLEAMGPGMPSTVGTAIFTDLPIILGIQLLLAAIGYDVVRTPKVPISRRNPEP